jgi:hypothetical protein
MGILPGMDRPRARMRLARLALACGTIAAAAGCAPRTQEPLAAPGAADAGGRGAEWPFWPRRMVIFPLSQFVTERATGQLLIEAHVEFLDEFGHTTKAVGHMTFELYDAAETRAGAPPAARWTGIAELDLTDPAKNRDRYDPITRTYLFKLKVGRLDLPDTVELHADFQSADGQRFEADYVLPSTTRPVTGPSR